MPKITNQIRQTALMGVNVHHNKFLIADNEAVFLKNVTSEIYGSNMRRNGYTKEGDTLQSGKTITGLHSQELNNGTKRLLATVNDAGNTAGVLKYLNAGTWTTISGTSIVEDSKTEFINWLNQVFIVGYDPTDGAYNTIKELSNLTVGTTNLTNAPSSKYGIVYNDQLYLGNILIGATQYPSYLAYSDVPTIAGAITWNPTITGMLGIGISDGDEITGLAVAYGEMLVYKNNSTWVTDGTSQYKMSSYGTKSNRSIKNVGQNVFAFHWGTDRKGITMFDGQGLKVISDTIEPILNGVTEQGAIDSVAGTKEGHYYLYVGDVTISEDYAEYHKIPTTISRCLIDYDYVHSTVANPVITIHSLPIAVKCMEEYGGKLYFGSTDGNVYEYDSGSSDNGTPIEADIITKTYYGTDPDSLKDYTRIIIYMNKRTPASAMYSIDNGDWQSLGDLNEEFNVFTKYFGTGHGIKIRIIGYGTEGRFCFDGFNVEFTPKDVAK